MRIQGYIIIQYEKHIMSNRSPDKLAQAATGNIKSKHLTKDSGMVFTYLYDGPLINHVQDDEQPEYIFSNENKGYRITEPNGNERTPHHDGSEGKRYLLVTDQRLLCVAGCKDGDESIEHVYDDIVEIERVGRSNVQFRATDGKSYKFAQHGETKQTVDAAIDYISKKLAEGDEGKKVEKSDKSPAEVDPSNSEFEEEKVKFQANTWGIRIKIRDKSEKIGGKTGKMSTLKVTDMRIIASNPKIDGNKIFSLPLEGISDGELKAASALNPLNTKLSHTLTLYTTLKHLLMKDSDSGIERLENDESYQSLPVEIKINFPHGTGASKEDIKKALQYMSRKSKEFRTIPNKSEIFEHLDDDEELNLVTKGKKLEIVQGEQTESQYAGKGVYTAITDKRVVIIIGQRLTGDDVRTIAYDSIDGVDIDNNLVVDYLRIHSGGRTFKINIYDTNEAQEAIDYIRKKLEAPQEVVTQSELDSQQSNEEAQPSNKLRELKSLHEDGILTDEEFESKKEELLDDF